LLRRTAKSPFCRVFFAQAHIFAVRFAPRHTAKGVTRRLIPVPSVAFFAVRREKNARQRLSTVSCQTWRAPFAVRPDEKRTAKSLPCVLGPSVVSPREATDRQNYKHSQSLIQTMCNFTIE
jgi:hypothetical protein